MVAPPDPSEGRRRPDRPADVTSAAWLLIVLGALGVFAYTVVLASLIRLEESPSVWRIAAALAIWLVSGLEIIAGVMVLRLSNRWRAIGLAIAAAGAAFSLLNLFVGAPAVGALIGLTANVFVVVTLVRLREAFVA